MTLQAAITQAQTYISALSGIRAAPSTPPERVNVFPFVIARPGSGQIEFGATGTQKGLHNIVFELHIARKGDLPREVALTLPYVESIPNLLMYKLLNDSKWNSTISTFRSISYRFMTWDWSPELMTIGIEFTVNDVKIESALTA